MLEHRAFTQMMEPQSALARARILIVEDQPLVGLALQDLLARAGADAMSVTSDKAAYASLQEAGGHFDILVLDVDLGEGTTGFDIARYARARRPDVGIIFSSGSPPDWINTFGVEGALFVPKPCNDAAMLAACELVTLRREPLPTRAND